MLLHAALSDDNFDAVLAKLRFDAERDAVRQKVGLAAPAAAPAAPQAKPAAAPRPAAVGGVRPAARAVLQAAGRQAARCSKSGVPIAAPDGTASLKPTPSSCTAIWTSRHRRVALWRRSLPRWTDAPGCMGTRLEWLRSEEHHDRNLPLRSRGALREKTLPSRSAVQGMRDSLASDGHRSHRQLARLLR